MNVLITGGAGFIGSHLVDLFMKDNVVTVLDNLSIGGSTWNIDSHYGKDNFLFIYDDVRNHEVVDNLVSMNDIVIHAAAESHVDRSISSPLDFVSTNVVGTGVVLEAVNKHNKRMLMLSTDEVYGPGSPGSTFVETDAMSPSSPYSASKAGADLLCQSYYYTYGTDVTIVRGTNAYGPRQVEKVIPTYSKAAWAGRDLPVYGNGSQCREFLHVEDWVRAAQTALIYGGPGEIYNIGGGHELSNWELALKIIDITQTDSCIQQVEDRPGHDFRYGVSAKKLEGLGWYPEIPFEEGLMTTVFWYKGKGG